MQSDTCWLIKQFVAAKGYSFTKQMLRGGILEEVKKFEENKVRQFNLKNDEHQKQAKRSIEMRMQSWEQILSLGGLSESDELDQIIDAI